MTYAEFLTQVKEQRAAAIAAGSHPRFVALGPSVAMTLKRHLANITNAYHSANAVTLSGQVHGLDVYEDPELEADAVEVKERL